MKQTTIKYKCSCMQDEGSFDMDARSPGESTESFMTRLTVALGRDHTKRNPVCRATEVEHVRFHVPEGKGMGEI